MEGSRGSGSRSNSSGKKSYDVGSSSDRRSKKQKTLADYGVVAADVPSQSVMIDEDEDSESAIQLRLGVWRDHWYDMFEWLIFDRDSARAYCKVCKSGGSKGTFAVTGSINIQKSAFDDHERSGEHKKRRLVSLVLRHQMEKVMATAKVRAEGSIMKLFYTAYFFGKENIAFAKFPRIFQLLKCVGTDIPDKMYQCDKACASMIENISEVLAQRTLERVRKSPFYGIMIDESTDIEVTSNLVIFVTFLEKSQVQVAYLGLVQCLEPNSDGISGQIVALLAKWGLSYERLVAFGSDGASVMTGKQNGVATRLKRLVNPYLVSCHCVAHRTNLSLLDASKGRLTQAVFDEIDELLNSCAAYFKKSCKRRQNLKSLQTEFADSRKILKRFIRVRWLSRAHAVTRLCDSLESVLKLMRDSEGDHGLGKRLFAKLADFRILYILYFLADILTSLNKLSSVFQHKVVDVSSIGGIVTAEVMSIRMLNMVDSIDMNAIGFTGALGYPVLPEFGPEGGYMKRLPSELRGNLYHSIQIQRDPEGQDLEAAVSFQKAYSQAVCDALLERFSDNDLISSMKVLSTSQMPSSLTALRNWGVVDIGKLADHFGEVKHVHGVPRDVLLHGSALKAEFFSFKSHAAAEFSDLSFFELWTMVDCNPSLKVKYPNLSILSAIARVQCVSTAQCERAFSGQNMVKDKYRNSLSICHLDALLRIHLEGPPVKYECQELLSIIIDAVDIWKQSKAYRALFTNPEQHLQSIDTAL